NKHSEDYRKYLKIFDSKNLELDPKLVGLPGSPTIVYKVEKIPRAKTSRKAEIVIPSNSNNLAPVIEKIIQTVRGK
ncbi:MAG TPA: electron transfer flavoprotein subunit beta, partial [Nitrososphaeraceae archaeon]|nr:electron transfer flavoprotein subunit beta [Nitrososphaeraceae archaeon]